MQISKNGLNLIISFEGLKLDPYKDSAGIPTIGYGTILYPDGTSVTMDDSTITQDQASQYLEWEVNQKAAHVTNLVTVPVNQNQFDALVSFAYNEGVGGLGGSTLLKLLNSGDYDGAAAQFPKWDVAGGHVVDGLERRRLAEQALFQQPI
jgi:lysozyme